MRPSRPLSRDARRSKLLAAVSSPVRRGVERRWVVLGASALSFLVIFAARELASPRGDAISLLYVIPVALVSLELGLRAGILAGAVAVGAVAIWMASRGLVVDGLSLIVRSVIFVSVAVIAGRFSDRMRVHSRREERLLRSGLDLAQIGDAGSLARVLAEHVQLCTEAAAVRVKLETGPAVIVGERGGETTEVPIVSHGVRLGSLSVSAGDGRHFAPEDRLMIETLALQAAVACENQRLLAVEREQVALHSEMDQMRLRLGDQLRNASHVLQRHERERRGIARQLREEAAQAMAAALITVASLERGVGEEVTKPQLEGVRRDMRSCIVDLRRIAASLRPSVLDEMGLSSALALISEEQAQAGRRVTFVVEALPPRLPREVETSTYRVIEALLDALVSASSIEARLQMSAESLRILFDARLPAEAATPEAATRDGEAAACSPADAALPAFAESSSAAGGKESWLAVGAARAGDDLLAPAVESAGEARLPSGEGGADGACLGDATDRGDATDQASCFAAPFVGDAPAGSEAESALCPPDGLAGPPAPRSGASEGSQRLAHGELMSARAHVELIGGSLEVSEEAGETVSILAEIPVALDGGAA